MVGVYHEVRGVDVISLQHHLEHFWLVNRAFLHKVHDFILLGYCVINIVVYLNLNLILELAGFVQEVLIIDGVGEIFTVFGQEVELADMGPRIEPVSHWVHGPESDILASSQEVHFVDLLVQMLPVEGLRQPGETASEIQEREGDLPFPHEGVHKENVHGQGCHGGDGAIWVFQIYCAMLDVIAAPQQQLTLSVELKGV